LRGRWGPWGHATTGGGLPSTVGARVGGGGSLEWSQWKCALNLALVALF
jgi:hypothetical protein